MSAVELDAPIEQEASESEAFARGADQRPDHRERRSRRGAAADRDMVAVVDQRRGLLQRHDLLAQTAVAGLGAFS